MNWTEYYIALADLVSKKSKDPNTKVGAVIIGHDNEIITTGFNGFPRGVREYGSLPCEWCGGTGEARRSMERLGEDPPTECSSCAGKGFHYSDTVEICSERWSSPTKYQYVVHAEENAIFNAARIGTSLAGCTLVLNYSPKDICNECAKALIQSGVNAWVGPDRHIPSRPGRPFILSWEKDSPTYNMVNEVGINVVEVPYEEIT